MVKNVQGLFAPEPFPNYYVDAFSEFDTSIPLFASNRPCICQKIGPKILVAIGNYAYQLFHVDLRWGIFYDYYYKASDSFGRATKPNDCDNEPVVIDECAMNAWTDQNSHTVSTNITYKFKNLFELGTGISVTVLGKNVPKTRNFYISLVAVF